MSPASADLHAGPVDLATTAADVRSRVVGREDELELVLAAVATGRDLVLEGPPGTSKTTLLRAITEAWGIPLVFVEGNAELTPGRLLGHHDPSRVLQEGFTADTFTPGPLVRAMQEGGFLHFEELNRAPEDTLNTLLTAIADREVTIPRFGTVRAAPTFRVVGSMNPFDNVGTTRLSVSIKDRLCRLVLGYQEATAEEDVVVLRSAADRSRAVDDRAVGDAVALTRRTRHHEHVRQGSSVRGAIDLFVLLQQLCTMREITADDPRYPETAFEAMLLALSGRISVDEATDATPHGVLREIWESHFVLDPATAQPG